MVLVHEASCIPYFLCFDTSSLKEYSSIDIRNKWRLWWWNDFSCFQSIMLKKFHQLSFSVIRNILFHQISFVEHKMETHFSLFYIFCRSQYLSSLLIKQEHFLTDFYRFFLLFCRSQYLYQWDGEAHTKLLRVKTPI